MENENKSKRIRIPFQLDERGIFWHVAVFLVIGVAATVVIALYSGSDALAYRLLEIAVTRLNWAIAPSIAYTVERIREVFRTNAEIRKAARQHVREEGVIEGLSKGREEGMEAGIKIGRQKGFDEGIEIGEQRAEDKLRASLEEIGVVLSPEDADRVFNHRNGEES